MERWYGTLRGLVAPLRRRTRCLSWIATRHIFANGMLVATIAKNGGNSTTTYAHTDHLTGSNVITDANGAVAETLDYYPYGVARIDAKVGGYAGEQRKFAGHEFDAQTALSYMGARYYDSTRGQFGP